MARVRTNTNRSFSELALVRTLVPGGRQRGHWFEPWFPGEGSDGLSGGGRGGHWFEPWSPGEGSEGIGSNPGPREAAAGHWFEP